MDGSPDQAAPDAAHLFSDQDWSRVVRILGFSRREAELAWHLLDGRKLRQASQEMHLALGTTKTYCERLYRKLDAHSHRDLVVSVFRAHLSDRPRSFEP